MTPIDPEVLLLRDLRSRYAERVASGVLTPLEALQRLHIAVDVYNLRRHPRVRNWGRR